MDTQNFSGKSKLIRISVINWKNLNRIKTEFEIKNLDLVIYAILLVYKKNDILPLLEKELEAMKKIKFKGEKNAE